MRVAMWLDARSLGVALPIAGCAYAITYAVKLVVLLEEYGQGAADRAASSHCFSSTLRVPCREGVLRGLAHPHR